MDTPQRGLVHKTASPHKKRPEGRFFTLFSGNKHGIQWLSPLIGFKGNVRVFLFCLVDFFEAVFRGKIFSGVDSYDFRIFCNEVGQYVQEAFGEILFCNDFMVFMMPMKSSLWITVSPTMLSLTAVVIMAVAMSPIRSFMAARFSSSVLSSEKAMAAASPSMGLVEGTIWTFHPSFSGAAGLPG